MTKSIVAAIFLVACSSATASGAATLTTLVAFNETNGARPIGAPIVDAAGNVYGTTISGGATGYGTVFKISSGGAFTTLATFDGSDGTGVYPFGGLTADGAGNLYGTTRGGSYSTYAGPNYGTVFKLAANGALTTLATFTGGNGANPYGNLIRDAAGNLFGTTSTGGAAGGTVFKISNGGMFSTLATHTGSEGGLVSDSAGNLYGTSDGRGAVFKLAANGTLSTVVTLNGASLHAGLTIDPAGNLYGTTYDGGTSGYGSIFKVSAASAFSTLASFSAGTEGAYPYYGALIADAAGNLYGTTKAGGTANAGTVFKLSNSGALSTLFSFTGGNVGADPLGGLAADVAGNLYGTTYNSSANSGTVFKLSGTGFVVDRVGAIPESGTWALMIAGFGLTGVALRRRTSTLTEVSC